MMYDLRHKKFAMVLTNFSALTTARSLGYRHLWGLNAMRTESIIFGFIALSSALILSGLFLMMPPP